MLTEQLNALAMCRLEATMSDYDDIIGLPHHVSPVHRPMDMGARAAQFAPFSALTGFDDAIAEQRRVTDDRPVLTDHELTRLNRQLSDILVRGISELSITFFAPDCRKDGGAIRTIIGRIRDIKQLPAQLRLTDGHTIPLTAIIDIRPATQ